MPEGTTPGSAVRQQAAGPQSRGLRIGNVTIPWWVVGVGAVGVGLVGYLIYRNQQAAGPAASASGSSAGTPMSPGVSDSGTPSAATLVPLPYPVSSTTQSTTTPTAASGLATLIDAPGTQQVPFYTSPWTGSKGTPAVQVKNPGQVQVTGPPISEPGNPYGGAQYPVNYLGQTYYVNAANVSATSLTNTQLAPSAA